MRFRVNRIALSLATAFLMISSIVTMATSAAGTNQLTLSADKTDVQTGDTFNVTIGYKPDSRGIAGFTISLHYDSSKLSVYIPTEEELESTYDVSGKFSVITNYSATGDTIKIVGANLKGSNVNQNTDLALATFTVKDGAAGDLNYWFEVETMVRATDDGYETASYSAPTQNSPYTVNGPVKASVTTSKETTTTTTVKTTDAADNTDTFSVTVKETSAVTTEANTDETEVSKETAAATEQTTVAETTTQSVTEAESSEPLFTYEQGANDFQSEEALQYGFRLSDYITDYSKIYNIKINFNTTGNINGAIGMLVDGVWDSQSNKSYGVTQDSWVYENLDPNSTSDLVYMQVYYMKAFSELEVTSIEVIAVGEEDSVIGAVTKSPVVQVPSEVTTAETTSVPAEATTEAEDVGTDATSSEESAQTEPASEVTDKVQAAETEQSSEIEENSETTEALPETESDTVTTASVNSSAEVTTNASEKEDIINAVDSAASTAKKTVDSNENPNTGSAVKTVMNLLNIASIAVIAFSLFAVIYNKIADKKEDEGEY